MLRGTSDGTRGELVLGTSGWALSFAEIDDWISVLLLWAELSLCGSLWRSSCRRVWCGRLQCSLRQRFVVGHPFDWWFVFRKLKQSLCSHAISFLSFNALDLKTGQNAARCLSEQTTHFCSLTWAEFPTSFLRSWTWTGLGGLVLVARECSFKFDFGLVHDCFLFHSSYMKSSSVLNKVENLLQSHFAKLLLVASHVTRKRTNYGYNWRQRNSKRFLK